LQAVRTMGKTTRTHRSKFEITAEIMQNCLLPRGKTYIMYNGNMSFAQTNAYLSLLTSQGLLSQENGKYETTDKGRQFISAYNQLGKIIGMPPVACKDESPLTLLSAR
jgi:predicted transcriptional regulator